MSTNPTAPASPARSRRGSGARAEDLRLQLLIEHSNDVLCELRDGMLTYVSPNSSRVSGRSPADLVGSSIASLVHPEDLHILAPFLSPGWTGQIDATFRVSDADGAWKWREARGTRVIDEHGLHRSVLVLRDVSQRHDAEDTLRLSESRSKALLAAIPDLMFQMTRNGDYVDFNAERHDDLYVPADTIIGSNIRDLLPPEVAEPALRAIGSALDGGSVETFHYTLVKKGVPRDYESRVTACGSDEVVVLCRDVTESNRAGTALKDSERRYRSLIDSARDVVYTHDLQGNFTSINPMASTLYGYNREELLGMNLAQIVDPQHVPVALDNMARAFRGELMLAPLEFLTYAKDGRAIWVEVMADPIVKDDEIVGFQGITRDITTRKEAEERVRLQAQLLDTVRQAVVGIDLTGRITFWNRFAEELYGWSSEELLGKEALNIAQPQNVPAWIAALKTIAEDKHWAGELTMQDRRGRRFPALLLSAPLYDSAGTRIGGVCVSSDISVLKNVEDEMQQSDERTAVMRERARIAQELHDSVAQFFFGIGITSKELLDRKSTSPTLLKRRLSHIRRLSAEGGREIRNAIRALSTSGVADGIDASIARLLDPLQDDGIAVSFEHAPHEAAIRPEIARELYRGAREALFNARKHARASRVDVGITVNTTEVVLAVADDGVGSAEELRDRVGCGTGYGLKSLANRLQALGGKLDITDGRQTGVVVTCSLPLEAE